jgi:hypothetical protein
MLAIELGTTAQPAWVLPEHTYYSDAPDLSRIIRRTNADLEALNARDKVKILPGLRILRQPASTIAERAKVIHDSDVPGYWLYELSDLGPGKGIIDFEGADRSAAGVREGAEGSERLAQEMKSRLRLSGK